MNMIRFYLFLMTAWLAAGGAHAALYQVDGAASMAQFEVDAIGSGRVTGQLSHIRGQVELDEQARSGAADVQFDMNAVDTGRDMLNRLIRSHYIFDTDQYPAMRFQSSHLEFSGDQLSAASGRLTLHGVTRPVYLLVRSFACEGVPASEARRRCSGVFQTTILRSEFGMNKLGLVVDDQVFITVKLSLEKIEPVAEVLQ